MKTTLHSPRQTIRTSEPYNNFTLHSLLHWSRIWQLYLIAVIPLLAVILAHIFLDIRFGDMTRDALSISGLHPLSGFLSALGILLWWSSASVWVFSALVYKQQGDIVLSSFAWCSAGLSIFMTLDDQFQFHETLAPQYLLIPEIAVYAILALSMLTYLIYFRHVILQSYSLLLLLSLGFMAASVLVDLAEGRSVPLIWRLGGWFYLFEDGFKWLAIVFWTAFCVARCKTDVTRLFDHSTR